MNIKVLVGIAIIAIIGIAGFFLLGSDDSSTEANNSIQQQTAQTTEPEEQKNEEITQVVTIDTAIEEVGMACQSSGATESTCTLDGIEYMLTKPTDWSKDESLRKQACDQGYISTNYQILSDGSGYYFTTDNNEDLQTLNTSLSGVGVEVDVVAYCG